MSDPSSSLASEKAALRRMLRRRRRALAAAAPDAAVAAAAALPADRLPPGPVGGYLGLGAELDPAPLISGLRRLGREILLPAGEATDAPLIFRAWVEGEPLAPDAFGVPAPVSGPPRAPAVLIVPLLAYDARGGRLGQGGGTYDRTIAALKPQGSPYLLGLAYAGQEIDQVPMEPHDQPLDAILTEAGFIQFG